MIAQDPEAMGKIEKAYTDNSVTAEEIKDAFVKNGMGNVRNQRLKDNKIRIKKKKKNQQGKIFKSHKRKGTSQEIKTMTRVEA